MSWRDTERDVIVDVTEVTENLRKCKKDSRRRIRRTMNRLADQMEKYMKENAPWEDRTGRTREQLSAKVEDDFSEDGVILNIKVSNETVNDRGQHFAGWLEEGHGGPWPAKPYPIVEPTVEIFREALIDSMTYMLDRLSL